MRAVGVAALACVLAQPALASRSSSSAQQHRLWVEAQGRTLHQQRSSLAEVARKAMPAVVSITTRTAAPEGATAGAEDEPQKGIGSGFIIHPDGYILTSAHVVAGADSVSISVLNARGEAEEYEAAVVGEDERTDFALLKIDAPRKLPVLKLATAERVQVADWIVVIGNPFGLAHSVTVGVVSYKGRTDITPNGHDADFDYLQTDASINPGNSGGPVLDLQGEVVAIANAVNVTGQGIGFAIPIDIAKAVLPQLKEHGRVRRGWLGISVADWSPELADSLNLSRRQHGIVVTDVVAGSPADEAGLRVGDLISGLDGKPLSRAHALRWAMSTRQEGHSVGLHVRRDTKRFAVRVRLGNPPPEVPSPSQVAQAKGTPPAAPPSTLGASVEDLLAEADPGTHSNPLGAFIRSVQPDSVLGRAGLTPGDVVFQVNAADVSGRDELVGKLDALGPGSPVALTVRRGGKTLDLAFKKP
ncbi:trypsin-like peptidase domain-containing protein [Aggregicoccus sp. 17bor-14]|uniref:trypsin-like peptidase domain-containing protein n=1 Tax=Myxococcaceae TaxID=31 RepID=UPI00351A4543